MQSISFIPKFDLYTGESCSQQIHCYGTGLHVGAIITADTGCSRCGGLFLAGQAITADLAPDMAGTVRHTDCADPTLERA